MLGYFIKRVLLILPTVMSVILVIFLLMALLPGTNTRQMVRYSDDVKGAEPLSLPAQYFKYCWRVLTRLDFGLNSSSRIPLSGDLMIRFGRTSLLTLVSLLVTLAIGVPLGIWCAVRRGTWQDTAVTALTTLISAIPAFCVALWVVVIFVLRLRVAPLFIRRPQDYWEPLLVLSIGGIANVARITRSAMVEVLSKNYITALYSLGLAPRSVILRHALKNALVPIVSMLTGIAAQLFCGAVVVERFFSLRGLSFYLSSAISDRSTSIVLGTTAVISFAMSVLSLAADMLFVAVNPSIRETLTWRSGLKKKGVRS